MVTDKTVYDLYLIDEGEVGLNPIAVIGLENVINKVDKYKEYYDEIRVTKSNRDKVLLSCTDKEVEIIDVEILNGLNLELINHNDKIIVSTEELSDDEELLIYLINQDGTYEAPDKKYQLEEAIQIVKENKDNYREVILTDLMDLTLLHIVEGDLIFPTES